MGYSIRGNPRSRAAGWMLRLEQELVPEVVLVLEVVEAGVIPAPRVAGFVRRSGGGRSRRFV